MEEVTAKPFVKAVGGKRQLVPELLKHVPDKIDTYYEPFVGGGALFYALAPRIKRAVLGDANESLLRAYMGVRDDVEQVMGLLRAKKYEEAFYYEHRARDPATMDEAEVAAWFIYINKCGFNGLWRVNRKGKCNVPFGRYTNPTICDEPTLRACAAVLKKKRANLRTTDFEKTVKSAESGDFVYFDPPYVPVSTTADFTSYTAAGFTWADQERLRNVACTLRNRGVRVMLSNADVPAVRSLYRAFKIERVEARRAINSNASKRGNVGEVIIT